MVNHRGCRQVEELSTDNNVTNTQGLFANIQDVLRRLNDAKIFMTTPVLQHQKNNKDIQLHVDFSIPQLIQEMRASINQTLDKLEKLLKSEAVALGKQKIEKGSSEIARWHSHIKTVNYEVALLTIAEQNGSDVHKCITAKAALETLNEINMDFCQQGCQLNLKRCHFHAQPPSLYVL